MSLHNLVLILLATGLWVCLPQLASLEPDAGIDALLQMAGIMPALGVDLEVSSRDALISYDYPVNVTPIRVSQSVVGPIGNPGLPSTPGTGGVTGAAGGANASQAGVSAAGAIVPSINVLDQAVINGTINVAEVKSNGPGWVVIFNDTGGRPYMGIGFITVMGGTSRDAEVGVNIQALTPTLYAVLYSDLGQMGLFEHPGPDIQQTVNGQPVLMPFEITNFGQASHGVQLSAINQTLSGISQSQTAVL